MKGAIGCNCFVGTAVVDADGNCHCIDSPVGGGVMQTMNIPPLQRQRVYILNPTTKQNDPAPAATAADDNTIFGFNPLVVLGAAAVGLYFLSTMGEKDGKTK